VPHRDERGLVARTWCRETFAAMGIDVTFEQCSLSINAQAGTVRGLHYQAAPFGEGKLVRCARGRIYDVAVDLREDSPSFKQWVAFELAATELRQVYMPAGVAHGFQTLEDDTEVLYLMSTAYQPDAARGVRWDDRAFGIRWPRPVTAISPRDRAFPDFAG
jgi:dTDP-4-dehydrorhamnose 3,5-epimerase